MRDAQPATTAHLLLRLPDELITLVLAKLPLVENGSLRGVAAAAATCVRLSCLVSADDLWRALLCARLGIDAEGAVEGERWRELLRGYRHPIPRSLESAAPTLHVRGLVMRFAGRLGSNQAARALDPFATAAESTVAIRTRADGSTRVLFSDVAYFEAEVSGSKTQVLGQPRGGGGGGGGGGEDLSGDSGGEGVVCTACGAACAADGHALPLCSGCATQGDPAPPGGLVPCVALGLASADFPLRRRQPGWLARSLGWHGDDGCVFHGPGPEVLRLERFGEGDTVGCGMHLFTRAVFFTLNGRLLPTTMVMPSSPLLYPTIGIDAHVSVRLNFGMSPFKFEPEAATATLEAYTPALRIFVFFHDVQASEQNDDDDDDDDDDLYDGDYFSDIALGDEYDFFESDETEFDGSATDDSAAGEGGEGANEGGAEGDDGGDGDDDDGGNDDDEDDVGEAGGDAAHSSGEDSDYGSDVQIVSVYVESVNAE